MFRLLVGIFLSILRTGFTGRLLLLFGVVLIIAYVIKVLSQLGRQ